jgi:hypothetical protein
MVVMTVWGKEKRLTVAAGVRKMTVMDIQQ